VCTIPPPPGGIKVSSGSGLVENDAPHCLEDEIAVITDCYTDDFGRAGVRWDCYSLIVAVEPVE